ncbi:MAG: hypothetical protein OEL87_00335, partial [Nanoarchaeota archaeon]|nr:hypothetical protein [Nanoarchaeota archaeon]
KILRQIGGLFAPGIGALFLIFFDKDYLILVSISFFILALIPLFSIRLDYMKPRGKQTLKQFFKSKEEKINFLSRGLFSLHSTNELTLLPLFVFITFANIEAIGILPMIAAISSIIFIYYIGELTDRFNHRALILLGAISIAFVWILRIIFPQIGVFYISTLLMGLFSVLIAVPLDSQIIERGRKTSILDTSTYRNAFCMSSNVVLYGTLYVALEVFKISFAIAVFAMITLSLISGLMLSDKKH